MTEDEARERVRSMFGVEAFARIERFAAMVEDENTRQNLVASSTIPMMWSRHIWDSLQLVPLSNGREAEDWIDIGSGGGFPGMVVGMVRTGRTLLVEPRTRRADFLRRVVAELDLESRIVVTKARIEQVSASAGIISARAVARIEELFRIAHHCATPSCRWLLPRGMLTKDEVDDLRSRWRFVFHVKQSDIDANSAIAIFDEVTRR